MKIDHLAIWVNDLDIMKAFYEKYFGGQAGERYHNSTKNFTSYFLSFEDGTRLELMQKSDIPKNLNSAIDQYIGLNHLAISVGGQKIVDRLTERLRSDGYRVIGEPRTTGDGYYESVILDPEDTRIEITV